MPTIPKRLTITNAADEVLNVIRNQASINYKNYVPFAQNNAESIRAIGAIIMDSPDLRNEFLNGLINRVGLVLINSMAFSNPWAKFKRGFLEYGETVEEIWVDIALPEEFSPADAEETLFKRNIPEVKAAFHVLNYQKHYDTTVSMAQLKQAFLSASGVMDLVNKITNALYVAMEYDEFLTMRYMIARKILDGQFYYIESKGASGATYEEAKANAHQSLINLRKTNNDIVFPSRLYNAAGVLNKSDLSEQQIIIDGEFEANVDVNALAGAFNLSYAEFKVKRILTPRFYFNADETARLAILFKDNPEFRPITETENTALHGVHAVVLDDNWFMIFDNEQSLEDIYNPKGKYWNYFLHAWKTFSTSPYMTAVALVDETVLNNENQLSQTFTLSLVDMTGTPVEGAVLKTNTTYAVVPMAGNTPVIPETSVIAGIETDNDTIYVDVARGTITTTTATNNDEDITITVTFTNGSTSTVTFTVA